MSSRLPVLLLALLLAPISRADEATVRLVTWNVERMFDATDDPDRKDDVRTEHQVAQKVANVAAVLGKIGAGGPEIVAFQEIENAALLRRIGKRLHGRTRFDVRFAASSGSSPIGVGVLTTWSVLGSKVVPYSAFATRPMLHVRLAPRGAKRPVLDLIVVHWRSMRVTGKDDQLADDRLRFAQARETRALIDKLRSADPKIRLAVVGDFNADCGADSLARGLGVAMDEEGVLAAKGEVLFDAAARLSPSERGTTFWAFRTPPTWRGWMTLDHVLLSVDCLASRGALTLARDAGSRGRGAAVVRHASRPRKFDAPREGAEVEPNLKLGVSDHFPVVVWLRAK